MKILVTGGTGRIGANLSVELLGRGHEVRCLVYPGDASRADKLAGYERVEVVEGDLRDFDDVTRAVQGVDAIYHLAAAFGGPFDNRQYLNINGMGTLNILEAVRMDLPDLQRLVYACTEAIYWRLGEMGRFFEEPITEEMVSRYKQMPYFLTKWVGEELCMTYHRQYGIPATSMRFATVIEPGEFLNEDGLPVRFLLSPGLRTVRQRDRGYAGGGGDPPRVEVAMDRRRKAAAEPVPQWGAVQAGVRGCPGRRANSDPGPGEGHSGGRRVHAGRRSAVSLGRARALVCGAV